MIWSAPNHETGVEFIFVIVAKCIQHPLIVHHWLVLTPACVSPTDAALTPDRVMAVMKDVKDWRRVSRSVFVNVPHPIIQRIEAQHSAETERSCALGQWWLNTAPSPTLMDLAFALYRSEEYRALEKVAQYLPKGTHMENVQTGMLISCSLSLAAYLSQPGSFHWFLANIDKYTCHHGVSEEEQVST